ncbi:transposon-encoded TnpW family protein, partial [Agathobacter rectalis]
SSNTCIIINKSIASLNEGYKLIIRGEMIMEKMMNTKTEGNTFTKKIGQTVYVVRYHFNENAKETMQEKINRMLVTEASRQAVY